MNFTDLHERLRLELIRRIEADTLTGSRLAQQTGFRQAHISNFLNRKRALSLEGLDRVLAAQDLTIHQILPSESAEGTHPLDLSASASNPTSGSTPDDCVEFVPLVPFSVAMEADIIPTDAILETIPISAALLNENRRRCSPAQEFWRRFVAVRSDLEQASAMEPLIAPGAVVILDRHYTSLALYRSGQRNLYAVRCASRVLLRFADFDQDLLILRPNVTAFPVRLLPVGPRRSPSDFIIGRVCLVFNEL